MKKLLLLATLVISSCNTKEEFKNKRIVNIEGCEYFVNYNSYGNILTHKGNCKNYIHFKNK
jgi:hypothetical protein